MSTTPPIVMLRPGTVARGKLIWNNTVNKKVIGFLGIPYAEAPVGAHRFQPPKSKALWTGEKTFNAYGSIAVQNLDMLGAMMYPFEVPTSASEDCLYLNIWSPNIDKSANLPVMLWIHGGAFALGFSNFYDGSYICASQNVVVVSINYRLGPFGFLSTGDGAIKGNMGLLDQVEAIKWVSSNIKAFGGDPQNITLFGESAGSISISYHMLSPLTRGLFRRAICQSGTSLYPAAAWPQANMRKRLLKKLKNAGFLKTDGHSISQYLTSLTSEEVRQICGEEYQPTVDGHFLPDFPENLFKLGYLHPGLDVIYGFNSDEGAMFVYGSMNGYEPISDRSRAEELLHDIVAKMFFRGSSKTEEIKQLLRREYLSDDSVETLTHGLIQLHGDLLFVAPTFQCAQHSAEQGSGSTFVYAFEHRPTLSRYPDYIQADHGQEIMFVFGEPFLGRLPEKYNVLFSDDERRLSREITSMWCNFAATGNPCPTGRPEWPQYTNESQQYLSIKQRYDVKSRHKPSRMRLWQKEIPSLLASAKY